MEVMTLKQVPHMKWLFCCKPKALHLLDYICSKKEKVKLFPVYSSIYKSCFCSQTNYTQQLSTQLTLRANRVVQFADKILSNKQAIERDPWTKE